jgi:hypothetical protein
VKSKVKSMLIIFCDIKEIVHKEFLLAGHRVNYAYYCDVSRRLHENVRRFRLELWRQKNWLLSHENSPARTSFIGHDVGKAPWLSSPNLLYSVCPIEDKTERPPFWQHLGDWGRIAGGAEQPHRARLPGCIYKMAKRWERCVRAEGDCLELDGCQ